MSGLLYLVGGPSHLRLWLVASRNAAFLARLSAVGWQPPARRTEPLTDDHPDITRLLNIHW